MHGINMKMLYFTQVDLKKLLTFFAMYVYFYFPKQF